MVQIYEKVRTEKVEKVENQDDELIGDLDPRYFEEAIHLKEAKQRIRVSDIYAGSKFDFFSAF